MEITGKIIAVLEPRGGVSKNGNEWKIQEYVIETQDQYPRKVCFEVFGDDKIIEFNIQAGMQMTISFDIDAREWNGKWFNSVRAWKAVRLDATQQAAVAPSVIQMPKQQPSSKQDDDLPF